MKKLRIGITGLRRAGKTVFLTSLINHLLDGSEDTLAIFKDEGVTFSGKALPLKPLTAAFPYERYLDGFRQEEPDWPGRTFQVSEFRIGLVWKRGKKRRRIDLRLIDYPGERLIDMPLLGKSFERWSEETIQIAEVGLRKGLSESWRQKCDQITAGSHIEAESVSAAIAEYKTYLHACKDAGLTFLQPSGVLLEKGETLSLNLDFCPLPEPVLKAAPDLAQTLKSRYNAYIRDYVKPFRRTLVKCSRQIVLVDVLKILRQGVDSYNDTRRCLRSVLDAYGYSRHRFWLSPLRIVDWLTKIHRVAFVATKADQCARGTRANLKTLLEELVRPKHRELQATMPEGRLGFHFCAAHRCTKDTSKTYEGKALSCLQGVLLDNLEGAEGIWFPGEVPAEWPDTEWDPNEREFGFPDFAPTPLPKRDGAVIDHINLDKVFWHIIEGVIR